MKKIFTLVSIAFCAMSVNAQKETLDVMSEEVQAKIAAAIENPVDNTNPNFIEVPQSEKVFPEGTYPDNLEQVTGGNPVVMKDYIWEASTASIDLKAVSTPNLDAKANESWQICFNAADNMVISAEGYPTFTMAYKAKTGNPSLAYKDFYDLNGDGDAVHRVGETLWSPDCGQVPAKGLYYQFTTKAAGKLVLGVFVASGNRTLYIYNSTDNKIVPNTDINVAVYYQNNGFAYEGTEDEGTAKYLNVGTMPEDYIVQHTNGITQNRQCLGYVTFNVEAGKTYYVLSHNSQLGFYGYAFTPAGGTGISEVITVVNDDDAPVYNLAGQRVSKDTKGILIKNGKKFFNK